MTWLDHNRKFFLETMSPMLIEHFPNEFSHCACLVDGMGSEIMGYDDTLSHDHHMAPRLFILMKPEHYGQTGKQMQEKMGSASSNKYFGHGVVVETAEDHLLRFINFPHPPQTSEEWLSCHDQDLIHVTNGEVYHDPADLITSHRKTLSYYPKDVWKKRLADYCIEYTLCANFNLNRCVLREDYVGAKIFIGLGIRRALEIAHMLDERYAPYEKWLYPSFKNTSLAPKIDGLIKLISTSSDWEIIVGEFTKVTDEIAAELFYKKITNKIPKYEPKKKFGYKILYIAAWDILNSLPKSIGLLNTYRHQKYSQLNDQFMYALTRNEIMEHIHAPEETWDK